MGLITGGPDFHLYVVGKSQVGVDPPAPPLPAAGEPPLPEDVMPPVMSPPVPAALDELAPGIDPPVPPPPEPVVLLALDIGLPVPLVPAGGCSPSVVSLAQPASAAST
ncbi:hypothetical protein WME76_17510 [Sorangium sp. So ce119]|uniref:hypothetical protein n=1 Tax=Sorangium sp. So ce119 TaxID=3133279 RepID=UPI003F5D8740